MCWYFHSTIPNLNICVIVSDVDLNCAKTHLWRAPEIWGCPGPELVDEPWKGTGYVNKKQNNKQHPPEKRAAYENWTKKITLRWDPSFNSKIISLNLESGMNSSVNRGHTWVVNTRIRIAIKKVNSHSDLTFKNSILCCFCRKKEKD